MCSNNELRELIQKNDVENVKRFGEIKEDFTSALVKHSEMRNEELDAVLVKMESLDFWADLKKDIEVIAKFARFFLKWGTLLGGVITFIVLLGKKTWHFIFG